VNPVDASQILISKYLSLQLFQGFPEANGTLPVALYRLVDPAAPVDLPAPGTIKLTTADNRELDKLVSALGRSKATWRRALVLHEWLLQIGHKADDRLCTTLIRVCAQHGQAATALSLYDWMRTPVASGGAGLECTVYTYTAAMRAALMGNMLDRALEVWTHAEADHAREIDCRLCTTLIEVCARRGDTDRALDTYHRMRAAPADSKLAPTVHAYTAAMRAAAEGGRPTAALAIWDDMQGAGCKPTGHAYSAVISSCAAGGEWQRAVTLFDEMMKWGVKPDVVSCTALVTALGADGQWERAEKVVEWMLRNDIRPNVRTYTALVGALANARQWERASNIVTRMKGHALGSGVEPNAYTYSALLKAMGDHGKWQMAEAVFRQLENEQLTSMQADGTVGNKTTAVSNAAVEGDARGESAEERIAADILVARTAEIALRSLDDDNQDVDDAENISNTSASTSAATGFSYFSPAAASTTGTSSPEAPTTPSGNVSAAAWTTNNAASRGLQFDLGSALNASDYEKIDLHAITKTPAPTPTLPKAATTTPSPFSRNVPSSAVENNNIMANNSGLHSGKGVRGVVNEVVCGALMLAYERAGKWEDAVGVLDRARALGITPNTVMYNTAVSALGKAGKLDAAQELFHACPAPDAVTFETLIAAHGMAGDAEAAESLLREMRAAGHTPQDYAYCGIVAAYSLRGNWKAALKVKDRAAAEGVSPSVHLFNALIAACDRARQFDKAIALGQDMVAAGITPNSVTQELLQGVCNSGVAAIENQQAAVAALSAAVAAAGTVLMRAGMF
jgi:pentatricopeptide repeat protein